MDQAISLQTRNIIRYRKSSREQRSFVQREIRRKAFVQSMSENQDVNIVFKNIGSLFASCREKRDETIAQLQKMSLDYDSPYDYVACITVCLDAAFQEEIEHIRSQNVIKLIPVIIKIFTFENLPQKLVQKGLQQYLRAVDLLPQTFEEYWILPELASYYWKDNVDIKRIVVEILCRYLMVEKKMFHLRFLTSNTKEAILQILRCSSFRTRIFQSLNILTKARPQIALQYKFLLDAMIEILAQEPNVQVVKFWCVLAVEIACAECENDEMGSYELEENNLQDKNMVMDKNDLLARSKFGEACVCLFRSQQMNDEGIEVTLEWILNVIRMLYNQKQMYFVFQGNLLERSDLLEIIERLAGENKGYSKVAQQVLESLEKE